MSSANQAALERLIQQLMSGGTPEMKQQQATRNSEISTVRNERDNYTRDSAFADAQGLISQQMRRTLESMLPSINRAAEDAGSSGGALRALLMQDAAQRASESSAALGVQTAVQYGGINSNMSQVLEALTRVNPQATEALIQALNVAKGATSTSQTSSTTTGNQNTTSQNQTSSNSSQSTRSAENRDYAPFTAPPAVNSSNSQIYWGPQAGGAEPNYVGTTIDTLRQLAGDNAWSNYQI